METEATLLPITTGNHSLADLAYETASRLPRVA